jgi:hypothetical protein
MTPNNWHYLRRPDGTQNPPGLLDDEALRDRKSAPADPDADDGFWPLTGYE